MTSLDQLNSFFLNSTFNAIFFHFSICACLGSYFNLFAWRWPQIQERSWIADILDFFQEKKWPAPSIPPTVPSELSLSKPASFCPHCGVKIKVWHNVPVFGWFILMGRAACCGKAISFKYPFFEIVCGLIGVFSWLHFGNVTSSLVFLIFAMALCMAAQTDFESMLLPDSVSAFIMFTGLLLSISPWARISSNMSIFGIVIFFITLEAIRILGSLAFKKEAMGQGDPKFLAAIGAWVGPFALPQILLAASISALAYSLALYLVQRFQGEHVGLSRPLPFGPFLAIGGLFGYLVPASMLF